MQIKIIFILIEPQMGENIGAVARAMSNFGFCELRIVNPRDGWPNDKAAAMSAHGFFVIETASIYDKIQDAISDIHYTIATTGNSREINLKEYNISNFRQNFKKYVKNYKKKIKIGVMLGKESSGLSNAEIGMANCIVRIPTSDLNPSMNLGSAAAVLAYEFRNIYNDISKNTIQNLQNNHKSDLLKSNIDNKNTNQISKNQIATSADVDHLLCAIENLYDANRFSYKMKEKIRMIFLRAQCTRSELRLFYFLLDQKREKCDDAH